MNELLVYLLVMITLTSCETPVKNKNLSQVSTQVQPYKANFVQPIADESAQVSATLELVVKSLDKKRKMFLR